MQVVFLRTWAHDECRVQPPQVSLLQEGFHYGLSERLPSALLFQTRLPTGQPGCHAAQVAEKPREPGLLPRSQRSPAGARVAPESSGLLEKAVSAFWRGSTH